MRFRSFSPVAVLGALLCPALSSFAQTTPLDAAPNPFRKGDTVVIRFNFTGKKVVISGGGFGAGRIVTGKPFVRDTPRIATRYTVTRTYADPKSPKKLLTAKYTLVVSPERPLTLARYKAKRGWTFDYPKDWRHDHVNTPEEGQDGLIFFQQEEDALERLAIAVVPVKEGDTPAKLWSKVRPDVYSRYDKPVFLPEKETSHYLLPALSTEFVGLDHSHPGKKTHTMMLIFIQDDRGYLVSARTEEAKFEGRRLFLEKMVRSLVPVLVQPKTPEASPNKENALSPLPKSP